MKLPKGWHQVTIDQFLKYHTICTRKWEDPIDLEINILAALSGKETTELLKLKRPELLSHMKELDFLKNLPDTRISPTFKIKGQKYKAILTMDDMTAGQFVNFSDIIKGVKPEEYIYRMHELIGAMCIRQQRGLFLDGGKVCFTRYEYEGYKGNSETFLTLMPFSVAYPYYVFFCKVMDRYLAVTPSYLLKKIQKVQRKWRLIRGVRWGLWNTGAGTASMIRSAITTRFGGRKLTNGA